MENSSKFPFPTRPAARAWSLILVSLVAQACTAQAGPSSEQAVIARGKYLVDKVAKCADCHTPSLPSGEMDTSRSLQGSPLFCAPIEPTPGWMNVAPPIAGLPVGWTEEQLVSFLETGKKPGGAMPAPPMPTYTLTHEDAVAVAAYVRSLPGRAK